MTVTDEECQKPELEAARSRAAVMEKRAILVTLIRRRAPYRQQLAAADAYIEAIRVYAKATGRKLPVPNRHAILRQLG